MKGKFITIEGLDGSGKTTVLEHIKVFLEKESYPIELTREPGGTEKSEAIRNIILNGSIDKRTEVLLFAASRREHVVKKILPALNKGKIVISDRFLDSSIAYQVFARQVAYEEVMKINEFATENLTPDLTLYFDVDVKIALTRTKNRVDNNALDNEKLDFYQKVKDGYDNLAQKNQSRIIKIDANQPLENVIEKTLNIIKEKLEEWKEN